MAKDAISSIKSDRAFRSERVEQTRSARAELRSGNRSERADFQARNDDAVIRHKPIKTKPAKPIYNEGGQLETAPEPEAPSTPASTAQESVPASSEASSTASTTQKPVTPPNKRRERIQLEIGRELGYVPKEESKPAPAEASAESKKSSTASAAITQDASSFQSPEQQLEQLFAEQALATLK